MTIIDISIPVGPRTQIWPGDPLPEITALKTVERDGHRVSTLALGAHTGTHLDAPAHFFAGGLSVDQVPLEACLGPCRVLDVTSVEGRISEPELERRWAPAARVLLKTRNSGLYKRAEFDPHYVHLDSSAADFLVQQGVRLVGIDYLSVEGFHTIGAPVHHRLLGAGIVLLETLDLATVDPGEYYLIALPLRLPGSEASPVRALLIQPVEVEDLTQSSHPLQHAPVPWIPRRTGPI